ncbi:MAG: trehalase family glycosidase [Gammaproteobacteria bacterium]
MDNSPTHDEATLHPATRTLDSADVGLNSILALAGEMLAMIAAELGAHRDAGRIAAQTEAHKARIREQLWDARRGVFANRLWSGRFVSSLAPTSFYPLLAGAATPAQAQALVDHYLINPERFGGEWWLPAVSRADPAFQDNVYWRGRIWPPLHFLTYYGLRRYGFDEPAARLAGNGLRLFERAWQHRQCPENFNAVTGAALDQADTDSFYGWGALLPYLAVAEAIDCNPWEGWNITHRGAGTDTGPLGSAAGRLSAAHADRILSVSVDSEVVLRTDIVGRIRHLRIDAHGIAMQLPATTAGGWLEFPRLPTGQVLAAYLDQQALVIQTSGTGSRILLPAPSPAPRRFMLITTH